MFLQLHLTIDQEVQAICVSIFLHRLHHQSYSNSPRRPVFQIAIYSILHIFVPFSTVSHVRISDSGYITPINKKYNLYAMKFTH